MAKDGPWPEVDNEGGGEEAWPRHTKFTGWLWGQMGSYQSEVHSEPVLTETHAGKNVGVGVTKAYFKQLTLRGNFSDGGKSQLSQLYHQGVYLCSQTAVPQRLHSQHHPRYSQIFEERRGEYLVVTIQSGFESVLFSFKRFFFFTGFLHCFYMM